MPDITITADDVERLATKLDQIGDQLAPDEKALLLAVFQIAGEQISAHAATGPDDEVSGFQLGSGRLMNLSYASLPSGALGQGFKGSFAGGGPATFRNPNIAADTVGVSVGISW